MRYDVRSDGSLGAGKVFVDATGSPDAGDDAWDGLKVDQRGNLYASGPRGIWMISPSGKHLGTIIPPEHPHNMAWGDDDGATLYMTSQTSLYRVKLNIPGIRP
jgi:gluconolactonase